MVEEGCLAPVMLCRNFPSGHCHFLILSGDADAKVYSEGCVTIASGKEHTVR